MQITTRALIAFSVICRKDVAMAVKLRQSLILVLPLAIILYHLWHPRVSTDGSRVLYLHPQLQAPDQPLRLCAVPPGVELLSAAETQESALPQRLYFLGVPENSSYVAVLPATYTNVTVTLLTMRNPFGDFTEFGHTLERVNEVTPLTTSVYTNPSVSLVLPANKSIELEFSIANTSDPWPFMSVKVTRDA